MYICVYACVIYILSLYFKKSVKLEKITNA